MSKWPRKIIRIASALIALALLLTLAGYTYERMAESRDLKRFPPPGQLVDIGGRRLHIYCEGAGNPAVIVETGAAQSSANWRAVQASIAGTAKICVYDRAGFGWSDPGPAGRSIDDRATELSALLQKSEVAPPYVVVGHSYGGAVVRKFVRDHLNDVVGVVLVDAAEEEFVYSAEFGKVAGKIRQQMETFELLTRFGAVRAVLANKSDDDVASQMKVPRDFIAQNGLTVAGLSSGFFREYADELASYDLAPASEQHAGGFGVLGDIPLIVIRRGLALEGSTPAAEALWADSQTRLAKLSSRSEVIVAANSRHNIFYDEPDVVIGVIQRIVRDAQVRAQ